MQIINRSKKNILAIFDQSSIITGAHKRYFYLLEELAERDHYINLISPLKLEVKNVNNINTSPPSAKIPYSKKVETMLKILLNFRWLQKQCSKSNVILLFGFHCILPGLLFKKSLKIPIIFGVRGDLLEFKKFNMYTSALQSETVNKKIVTIKNIYISLFTFFEKYVYQHVDKIVVQNIYDKNSIIDKYNIDENKITIIPNNLNASWIKYQDIEPNNSKSLKQVIFIGTLRKRKGILNLLEAFKLLIDQRADLKLDIVGDGVLKKNVIDFINENNLKTCVQLHGYVKEPLKLLRDSDLLVVPSLIDPFPNVVLEALSVGTPVIGSKVGGIVDMLKYEQLLFEPGNYIEIYKYLIKLLDNDIYLNCKGKCAARREKFIFDWPGEFEKIL